LYIKLNLSNFIFIFTQLDISNININSKWIQIGITVAGGHGFRSALNELSHSEGLFIDDDQTIYVADTDNDRVVKWKSDATYGQIVAGGNGKGNRNDQLNVPRNVIIDEESDSLIISDYGNRRVVLWPRQNGRRGETIISNIDGWGLAIDSDGYLYVCDKKKNEVRRWKRGDMNGIVVAGGNDGGNRLNQLSSPHNIFVDQEHSVYVSDRDNHRVMKWTKNAIEGIVVAGDQGKGDTLTQLSKPRGITVDHLGTVYVADWDNHRVMRWLEGATQGSIVVGGNGQGKRSNQFNYPTDLSFDRQDNLYVLDSDNHRVQKFHIELNPN
jgi:sugar lactone lactonase YvrE